MDDVRNCEVRATVAPLTGRSRNDEWQQTVEVYSTYFCVVQILLKKHFCVVFLSYIINVLMLRFASSLGCPANWYQQRVLFRRSLLAPRRILSAKGNHLEVHHSLFQ